MTTKKKVGISDLLRDEAQKSSISNEITEKTIEVKAETVSETVSKGSGLLATSADDQAKANEQAKARSSDLEAELVRSQKREPELLQMITDLQKDLKFSQTNVELLQKSLAALESLKDELEQQLVEVKRDNLRLAEANIKLSESAKALESATIAPVEPPTASQLVPQSPQQNRATPRKQPVEQQYPNRDRTPYTRPTGSNEQLQRINNKNIGWMD